MREHFALSLRRLLIPFSLFFFYSPLASRAQNILDLTLDGSENGKSLTALFQEIGEKHNVRFYFLPEWVDSVMVEDVQQGHTLEQLLSDLFLGTDLTFFAMYPKAVVIIKDPTQAMLRRSAYETAVRQHKKIEEHTVGNRERAKKGKVLIQGTIFDSKDHTPIPRVNVVVNGTQSGTTTDNAGRYELRIDPGSFFINLSFIDYEDKVIDLSAFEDGELNLEMESMPIMLDEVVIQEHAAQELTTQRIGQTQMAIREIKRAPAFLGEVDLVRRVQTLPGVTTVGEAASGYNVRGGSVDQNLILFDGLPVYNITHGFGFLSPFNAEAVRDVSFYKGGIPAEFGGRASSVLDITSKDGDYQKWNGNAGIGMITSNFMINGPLQRGKTSLAASFRSTYSNWLIHTIKTDYADLSQTSVFFYDGTLKFTHLFSDRTKLSVTGYSSRDAFRLMGDSTYHWNNQVVSARLDHQISGKLGSEFVLGISKYGYTVKNVDDLTAFDLSYSIASTIAKAGFFFQSGSHKANFGWQGTYYQFDPGELKPTTPGSSAQYISIDRQFSLENAFYAADEWTLNPKITLEGGLRLPIFTSFGPASINVYQPGVPLSPETVIDALHYGAGRVIKTYAGLEPRVSFRWTVNPHSSIKFGYNRIFQFLQMVTNTTAITPVDIWQPSGYYFKPQRADQVSLGYFTDLHAKKYSASVEAFYKDIMNVLDFKDGAQLILNQHLETDLLQGKGHSYGIETSFTKNTGRLTGSLNYTFSRAFRQIAGATPGESINEGKQYPSTFDQPHVVNVTWKYNLSRRYFFTGNFTYHTGRPVTIPVSAYPYEGMTVAYFSGRNQYRIPDYHRLDLAFVFEGNHKRKKKAESTWVLSVYNVYGRNNPYTVFFKSSGTGVPMPYQLAIVGSPLPSISYNLKF